MATEKQRLSLTKTGYALFNKSWKDGKFKGKTYGQAFYDHFNLSKVCDQSSIRDLPNQDEKLAAQTIKNTFKFK